MAERGFKRKLAAVLSADVEGYSRLMGDDEETTVRTLTSYRTAISDLVQRFRGRIVDTPGDNILAEFTSVVDAVKCAVEIQRDLAVRNAELPYNRKMEFRIGVNIGDVIEEEGRIYGDGVNIAARLESLSEAGGICISGTVYDHIENKLEFEYEFMGEQAVKNISKPVRLYRVLVKTDDYVFSLGNKPKLPDKPSIAVLPFVNMSGDPHQYYFSDGLTEQIITGISKIENLFVIARNSTFVYKNKAVKVQQVGQELGVRYVLEGSVQKSGDRVRVNAQLIDATTGHHLWAEKYDEELKDIFELQDEITLRIITALEVKLTEGQQARLRSSKVFNLEAYLKMLKGFDYFRRHNREDNSLARQEVKEAIDLEPENSEYYTLLAATHVQDLWFGSTTSPLTSIEKATQYINKAFELDKDNSDAYLILGNLYLMQREHEQSITALQKAVALNPNGADAYCQLAYALHNSGKSVKAIDLLEKAIRLNPYPPSYYLMMLGIAYYAVGQTEESIEAFNKAILIEPNNIFSHVGLAATYIQAGKEALGREEAAKVIKMDPNFSLDNYEKTHPHINREYVKNIVDKLRKAGLK